jgi:hypothetical protein
MAIDVTALLWRMDNVDDVLIIQFAPPRRHARKHKLDMGGDSSYRLQTSCSAHSERASGRRQYVSLLDDRAQHRHEGGRSANATHVMALITNPGQLGTTLRNGAKP